LRCPAAATGLTVAAKRQTTSDPTPPFTIAAKRCH
jgi:hypothetical protein